MPRCWWRLFALSLSPGLGAHSSLSVPDFGARRRCPFRGSRDEALTNLAWIRIPTLDSIKALGLAMTRVSFCVGRPPNRQRPVFVQLKCWGMNIDCRGSMLGVVWFVPSRGRGCDRGTPDFLRSCRTFATGSNKLFGVECEGLPPCGPVY